MPAGRGLLAADRLQYRGDHLARHGPDRRSVREDVLAGPLVAHQNALPVAIARGVESDTRDAVKPVRCAQ